MFLKHFCRILKEIVYISIFALIGWLAVSWVDILLHNDPVYGDKQYMPGNAIVMMINLTE